MHRTLVHASCICATSAKTDLQFIPSHVFVWSHVRHTYPDVQQACCWPEERKEVSLFVHVFEMGTPDGDISILDALHNSGAMPLHCLCVDSHNLCQCVQRHIPDVVVPVHGTDRLMSMSACTHGKSCMLRSILQAGSAESFDN